MLPLLAITQLSSAQVRGAFGGARFKSLTYLQVCFCLLLVARDKLADCLQDTQIHDFLRLAVHFQLAFGD